MNKIRIGTIVKLKSGSKAMTSGVDDPKDKRKIICTWADENNPSIIYEKSFCKDQLEIVDNLKYLDDILKGIKS
jgi:hypothetical protein